MSATVFDVATYILEKCGAMTTMKLQKLAYYSQAWSLVWEDRPIFNEEFQAWANGPVAPALYNYHKGQYYIEKCTLGNAANLTAEDLTTIDSIIAHYGDKPSQWLSDLTHSEQPWLESRKGYSPGERSCNVISYASMAEYYSSL